MSNVFWRDPETGNQWEAKPEDRHISDVIIIETPQEDTITIEIEMVNTCFGIGAKFWKGNSMECKTDLRHVLDKMNYLTEYYKKTCGKAVLFTTK